MVNVQHDCERGDCQATGVKVLMQEREKTSRTVPVIEHSNDAHFIVNFHNMHHPHILRTLFDAEAYHMPACTDRKTLHATQATALRDKSRLNTSSTTTQAQNLGANERNTNPIGVLQPFESAWDISEWPVQADSVHSMNWQFDTPLQSTDFQFLLHYNHS